MDKARVITVIETTSITGAGTKEAPHREMAQYWSLDGKLLATRDELSEVLDEMEKFTEKFQ